MYITHTHYCYCMKLYDTLFPWTFKSKNKPNNKASATQINVIFAMMENQEREKFLMVRVH